jgi:hypothetical protein
MMPVRMVRHAVTAGMPPMPLAISIDTAAVAELGASESSVEGEAPSVLAITSPLTTLDQRSRHQSRRQSLQFQIELLQIAMQGDRQSDNRDSEQVVNNAHAIEVAGMGNARADQQGTDAADGQQGGVENRRLAAAAIGLGGDIVDADPQRQSDCRACRDLWQHSSPTLVLEVFDCGRTVRAVD